MVTRTVTLPDGRRKYVRGKTVTEAEEKIEAIKREISRGVDVTKNPTFREFYEQWFDLYKRPALRAGTVKNFESSFDLHVIPYLGHLKIKDIRTMHVQNVLSHADTLCRSAQLTLLTRIREVFDAAIDNDLILKTPVSSSLRVTGARKKDEQALTRVQTQTLLTAVSDTKADLFVRLLLCTGLRRSEAMGLRVRDVDRTEHVIHVRQQMSDTGETQVLKTDNGYRDIPIPEELERDLPRFGEYVIAHDDGSPYLPKQINCLWDLVTRRVDFPVHPHMLRYTYATRLFESGVDIKQVQYLLGHGKVEETLAIYVKYQAEERKEETADMVRHVRYS